MSTITDSLPKSETRPTPFFCDFNKKTSDFWDRDNYALGRQFEINASPSSKSNVKFKIKDGPTVTTNAKAAFDTKWGSIEVEESSKKGTSLAVHVNRVYGPWNLKSKYVSDETEITAECRPEDSFWATTLTGKYQPNEDGDRVCSANASVVVQDNYYNLAVGGKLELEDRRETGRQLQYQNLLKNYSMGFLYSPTNTTQYSLIYKPDKESSGVSYDLSLYKKMSDAVTVSGRAEGRADLRITSPPVLSLGASWSNNGNFFRGFLNSRKEYGASYQVKVNQNVHATLGLASLLSEDDMETTIGFKLNLS